jgi:hypothetical protein
MGRSGRDEVRGQPEEIAIAARVTVVPGPRGPALRERVAGVRLHVNAGAIVCIVALALAALTLGAVVGARRTAEPRAPVVSAASGHLAAVAPSEPPYCVSLAILLHDSRFASASFDRSIVCGRAPASGGVLGFAPGGPQGCRRLGAPAPVECFRPQP